MVSKSYFCWAMMSQFILVSGLSYSSEQEQIERAREAAEDSKAVSEAVVLYEALITIQAERTDSQTWELQGEPSKAEELLQEAVVAAVLERADEKRKEEDEE